jgi:hypothetical protein
MFFRYVAVFGLDLLQNRDQFASGAFETCEYIVSSLVRHCQTSQGLSPPAGVKVVTRCANPGSKRGIISGVDAAPQVQLSGFYFPLDDIHRQLLEKLGELEKVSRHELPGMGARQEFVDDPLSFGCPQVDTPISAGGIRSGVSQHLDRIGPDHLEDPPRRQSASKITKINGKPG